MRGLIAFAFIVTSFFFQDFGAAASHETAKLMLDRLGIKVTVDVFIDKVKQGDQNIVRLLLDAGMPADTTDQLGTTALIIASQNGHEKIVSDLLKARADRNKSDPLWGRTALTWAAEKGQLNVVKLLLQAGCPVNAKTEKQIHFGTEIPGGDTALMFATANGKVDVIKELLNAGADVTIRNESGKKAADLATGSDKDKILVLLIDAEKRHSQASVNGSQQSKTNEQ